MSPLAMEGARVGTWPRVHCTWGLSVPRVFPASSLSPHPAEGLQPKGFTFTVCEAGAGGGSSIAPSPKHILTPLLSKLQPESGGVLDTTSMVVIPSVCLEMEVMGSAKPSLCAQVSRCWFCWWWCPG